MEKLGSDQVVATKFLDLMAVYHIIFSKIIFSTNQCLDDITVPQSHLAVCEVDVLIFPHNKPLCVECEAVTAFNISMDEDAKCTGQFLRNMDFSNLFSC